MPKTTNPRKKKLDAINTKIITFMFQETYTDEVDAQKMLSQAVELIDNASKILVANDEKQSKPAMTAEE
jgi:hypothetical protein